MKFDLAHGSFEPKQEPVVGIAGIVDTVLIGEQPVKDPAQINEMMPVFARPRQAAHFQPKHDSNVLHCDFRQELLKSLAIVGATPTQTEILIDHQDAVGMPSERDGMIAKCILSSK